MTQDTVLVAYGSTRGGTAEIAQWIGDILSESGLTVQVRAANTVRSLDDYSAVVIGSALYAGRLHRHARRFTRRFADRLRERPVWLFGSGPLDDSLDQTQPAKVPGATAIQKTADRLNARSCTVFGGRLEPGAKGLLASSMAKTHAGDFRDRGHITDWASGIAAQLSKQPH
ncbi:flavodoxin domain-containing protein [Nocardia nova SH22a]|uniref:Flavodoxin domain-containing protein n=1 Tax=Nocardia nova SH22a TaxID=1415166 RepID=W5TGL7_9NOCA|nr:flavodoxin domain-containing protein [Nocardia nova]AHH18319.1 flavodoxin domain-containing protein [Nocardia nova SH22a]